MQKEATAKPDIRPQTLVKPIQFQQQINFRFSLM